MKPAFNIFRRISILVFSLIALLGILFIGITYLAISNYHQASTQLLAKDVASHIATFTSPFENDTINRKKADSVFYDAMVLSPSSEVYFLDTLGNVIAFHVSEKAIRLWKIPLQNIDRYIAAKGEKYIKAPDPRDLSHNKIFSAAKVRAAQKNIGYIYVILESKTSETIMSTVFGSHAGRLGLQALVAVILLSAGVSIFYFSRLEKNYNRVLGVLSKFENGDYSARFPVATNNDLAPITAAFNKIADLLATSIASLTRSEKDRKDFIATISHDLRTPLAIAKGYAETLFIKKSAAQLTDAQRQEYLQLILQKIQRVEVMVQQLFELSKLEAPEFRAQREPFVLSEIVQEAVNTFQLAAEEKEVSLKCTQCQYHVWVHADVSMLERVIQNLLVNAVNNTPKNGSIKVALTLEQKHLIFSISNTGEPLPNDLLHWTNHAEPANGLQSNRPSYMGLGLLIVQKILQLHGTALRAATATNTNVFSFALPVYTLGEDRLKIDGH